MNNSAEHQRLVHDILIKIGGMPEIRIWKNATGVARAFDNPDRVISFGLPGSPDIIGIMKGGRWLGIEVKTSNAKQSKEQKKFQAMIEKFGGLYILARCVESTLQKIISEL